MLSTSKQIERNERVSPRQLLTMNEILKVSIDRAVELSGA